MYVREGKHHCSQIQGHKDKYNLHMFPEGTYQNGETA